MTSDRLHPSETTSGDEVPVAEGETRLLEAMLRFEAAHERRSAAEMRACFHDDALIESIASDGRALGPDETAEAIVRAFTDGVYSIGDWQYEEISLDVVISRTGARHRLPGGMRDEQVFRLITGRDGLMWRARIFASRDEALACLEAHGPGLGL